MAYDDIYKGYREATRGLEEQAVQERERVTREYDTQRERLQEQLAKSEREVQRTLGELRSAERREQRRADLPSSMPRDIATRENMEAVRAEGERFSREVRDLQGQVSQARSESLTDIQQQVSAGKAKIQQWYKKAKAAQRKADRAVAKAEVKATAVAPAYDDAAEYYREYAPKVSKQDKAITGLAAVMQSINATEARKQTATWRKENIGYADAEIETQVSPKTTATKLRDTWKTVDEFMSKGPGQLQGLLSTKYEDYQKYIGRNSGDSTTKNKAKRVVGGLAGGIAISVLSPVAMLDTFAGSPPGLPSKLRTVKTLGTGMKDYFVSIPVAWSTDPYFTTGEVVGMLVGVKGAAKAVRTVRVWADPYGVPARAVGIEFSVSKIPTGTATATTMASIGKAVAKAQKDIMQGKLSGTATVGSVSIKYRGSPIQHTVGSVLMHAAPNVAELVKSPELIVKGEGLYFSTQLAPRFMASSAAGTVATKPGVVAVLTDASKVRTPSAKSLGKLSKQAGDNFIVHADEGLWTPSKLYKHAFENEIVASPGTKFTKTPSTLRTRLLGDKAGDLLVQYSGPDAPGIKSGQLVPVHIFADKGVFRAPPTPAALYSAKLITLWETLKDVGVRARHPLSGNKTFRITGNTLADQAALTKALKESAAKTAKDKVPSGTGKAYDTAYRRALTKEYAEAARAMEAGVSAAAARAYAKNPTRFEAAFSRNLVKNLNTVARAASAEQAYSDVRAASGRARSVPESQVRDWQRAEKESDIADQQRTTAGASRRRSDTQRERGAAPSEREAIPDTREEVPQRERTMPPQEREGTPPSERGKMPIEGREEVPPEERNEILPDGREKAPPGEEESPTVPERGRTPPPVPDSTSEIRIRFPDGTSVSLTRQQYAGIVAWRQGLFYILVYPPYGKAQTVYTRKPIAGIRYARGPESPQRSAAVIGGKLPRSFEVAMGIAKVRITPKTKTQPRLVFRSRAVPELGEIRKVKKHGRR